MMELLQKLAHPTPSKIVLLVMDGLGGLPHPQTGKTELEAAHTPNLDSLAYQGMAGLLHPVAPGITPGSAPGHLALFGYDPLRYLVGRGIVEALGIDFPLQPGDVAIRGNFCSVDQQGILVDRRAGRLPTEENARLCQLLATISLPQAQVLVAPVKEHRFVLVLRGEGLGEEVSDTDPQKDGVAPFPARGTSPPGEKTARLANAFIAQARQVLASRRPANMVLLRGFSRHPHLSTLSQLFHLHPAAIATYPMYRGLARLVGMEVLPTGPALEDQLATLKEHFPRFDYFFLHIKQTDLAGEDGDFERKVKAIEQVDALLPRLTALKPQVLAISADHSTPAAYGGHSWHPVPLLLASPWVRPDRLEKFSERACGRGGLGHLRAVEVMPLLLAHAGKLIKYGA